MSDSNYLKLRVKDLNAQIQQLETNRDLLLSKIASSRTNRDKYLETYSGKQLLRDHSLDERGIWNILGEDPNCDLGGNHSEPFLETVEGTLDKVIDYGVELRGFWQWGGGGSFTKHDNIVKPIKKLN